jgi:hypothetical protein
VGSPARLSPSRHCELLVVLQAHAVTARPRSITTGVENPGDEARFKIVIRPCDQAIRARRELVDLLVPLVASSASVGVS